MNPLTMGFNHESYLGTSLYISFVLFIDEVIKPEQAGLCQKRWCKHTGLTPRSAWNTLKRENEAGNVYGR